MTYVEIQNNNDGLNNEINLNDTQVAHSGSGVLVNGDSQTSIPLVSMQGSILMVKVSVLVLSGSVERSKKFNGLNFRRWQQNMYVVLPDDSQSLAWILTKKVPMVKEQEQDVQTISAVE